MAKENDRALETVVFSPKDYPFIENLGPGETADQYFAMFMQAFAEGRLRFSFGAENTGQAEIHAVIFDITRDEGAETNLVFCQFPTSPRRKGLTPQDFKHLEQLVMPVSDSPQRPEGLAGAITGQATAELMADSRKLPAVIPQGSRAMVGGDLEDRQAVAFRFAQQELDGRQLAMPIEFMSYMNRTLVNIVGEQNLPSDPTERFKLLGELAVIAKDFQVRMEQGDTAMELQHAMQEMYQALGRAVRRGKLTGVFTSDQVQKRLETLLTVAAIKVGEDMISDETRAKAELMLETQRLITAADVERATKAAKVAAEARTEAARGVAELAEARGTALANALGGLGEGLGKGMSGAGKGAGEGIGQFGGALVEKLGESIAKFGPQAGEGVRGLIGQKQGDEFTGLAGSMQTMGEAGAGLIGKVVGRPMDEMARILKDNPEATVVLTTMCGGGLVAVFVGLATGPIILAMGAGAGVGLLVTQGIKALNARRGGGGGGFGGGRIGP